MAEGVTLSSTAAPSSTIQVKKEWKSTNCYTQDIAHSAFLQKCMLPTDDGVGSGSERRKTICMVSLLVGQALQSDTTFG